MNIYIYIYIYVYIYIIYIELNKDSVWGVLIIRDYGTRIIGLSFSGCSILRCDGDNYMMIYVSCKSVTSDKCVQSPAPDYRLQPVHTPSLAGHVFFFLIAGLDQNKSWSKFGSLRISFFEKVQELVTFNNYHYFGVNTLILVQRNCSAALLLWDASVCCNRVWHVHFVAAHRIAGAAWHIWRAFLAKLGSPSRGNRFLVKNGPLTPTDPQKIPIKKRFPLSKWYGITELHDYMGTLP